MNNEHSPHPRAREWASRLAIFVSGLLVFETISGLAIWLLPFSVPSQLLVLLHTVAGLLFLVPYLAYQASHWWKYRQRSWSHSLLTGYVAFAAVLLNAVAGVVLTWEGVFGTRITYAWSTVHLVTTFAIVAFFLPHVVILLVRDRRSRATGFATLLRAERRWTVGVLGTNLAALALLVAGTALYRPVEWNNEFPPDYEWDESTSPFRPSLANTASGGAYDDRSLTGSESCGTAGCHEQIAAEWAVSAHRWSS
ncbi:MAG TPA: hypothetical protein VKU85_21275, partial [bacterium]|nr:hypothetical protein [bacterium]